jgi:CBS domain-containing protein
MMKLVRNILEEKSLQELITVAPDASVVEAARLMTLWNVGALLVLDAEGQMIGLVSERDFVREASVGEPLEARTVEDIMQREVRLVPAELSTEECMALMTHLRLRHLPVTDGERVLGIVSVGDLIRDVVGEQAFVIEQLELYIRRAANA